MADTLREEVTRLHAQICSGLADPNRILIIYSLAGGSCNVTEIAATVPRGMGRRSTINSVISVSSRLLIYCAPLWVIC